VSPRPRVPASTLLITIQADLILSPDRWAFEAVMNLYY